MYFLKSVFPHIITHRILVQFLGDRAFGSIQETVLNYPSFSLRECKVFLNQNRFSKSIETPLSTEMIITNFSEKLHTVEKSIRKEFAPIFVHTEMSSSIIENIPLINCRRTFDMIFSIH